MKEIKDFMHMIGDLTSMADCPNFSDGMRNKAVDLMLYLNNNTEPEKPTIEELQKRICDTIAYLNCGVVHEYEIIFKLLKGESND